MNYLQFKDQFLEFAIFNIHQVYAWQPHFDRNNITRWQKRGLLIKLRQGYYTFPEFKNSSDLSLYFANKLYQPSYISLHTALSFYGIIPEIVASITSVSSLKTTTFTNEFGDFVYKKIKEDYIFGYDLKPLSDKIAMKIATPEKAILDLLYLYPFYNTVQEIQELRFDEDFMQEELDKERLLEYTAKIKSRALERRIKTMLKTYDL
jgi:predicted transcriptional regulator of viral defense system